MDQNFDVFISYSRKDYKDEKGHVIPNNLMSRILKALEDAGISYWYDEEGIEYGDDFVEKILEHIESAPIFMYLSSKNANESRFTCREVAFADELRKYIIPIKLDKSAYGEKIMFRIVDIPPIKLFNNTDNALKEIVSKIQNHLTFIQQETQRKLEEERRQHEAEEAELLKEKNRRELKEQLDRLHQQHDEAKLAVIVAENVVNERRSLLDSTKQGLTEKEAQLLEAQTILKKLERELNSYSHNKVDSTPSEEDSHDSSKDETVLQDSIDEGIHINPATAPEKQPKGPRASSSQNHTEPLKKLSQLLNSFNLKAIGGKGFIGLLLLVALLILFFIMRACSSQKEQVSEHHPVVVDSIPESPSKRSDIDDTLNTIFASLSTIRPQLQEHIDGYRNHNAEATYRLAKCFEKGDFLEGNRNTGIAGRLYHIAADSGYAKAQTSLGFYFFKGRGGYTLNYDSSTYWYSEAIRNGAIDAKYYLALAYDDGRYTGTTQGARRTSDAMDLYRSSAESGYARSQIVLGINCYNKGKFLESKEWLEKALSDSAKLTDYEDEKAKAEFYMGQLYGTGKLSMVCGVSREQADKIAFEWYQKSATTGKGYTEAMFYLGICYQNARGTKQNLPKAQEWYIKAANRGHQQAKEKLIGKTTSPKRKTNKKRKQ